MKRIISLLILIMTSSYTMADTLNDQQLDPQLLLQDAYGLTQESSTGSEKRAVVNVQDFLPTGFVIDASVDYTSEVQAAVTYAYKNKKELYWPFICLTSSSISNMHNVRHKGPGGIKRGSDQFYIQPGPGQKNTLYCSAAAANDLGDGLSKQHPVREPRTAVNYLQNYGPSLDGSWIIRLAAGTYTGGISIPRNLHSRDFIKIIGPNVGGHPNIPTAIISKDTAPKHTFGVYASDGVLFWLQDVKITGAFAQAEYIARNVYYQRRNVHVDGALVGLQINNQSRYFNYGGIIENCKNMGISELFHITRSFDTANSAADGLIIRKCGIGLKAKENCVGHTDYITFEDNDIGIELQLFSGTNPKGAVFKRNGIGIVLVNSELHNENAIVWGKGADINTRRILSLGNSSEINSFGWAGDSSLRTGHRPLVLLGSSYAEIEHTGTLRETDIVSFPAVLKADMYAMKGKKYRVLVKGTVKKGTVLAEKVRILLKVGGMYMTDVTIPAGTVGNAPFQAEWEVTCTADGAHQFVSSLLHIDGKTPYVTGVKSTVDMSSDNRDLTISAILGNSADRVTFDIVEVFG
jgi:hypothetical protein